MTIKNSKHVLNCNAVNNQGNNTMHYDEHIPASNWVLDKVFFQAELVDNFDSKYKKWFAEYNGVTGDSESFTTFLTNLHEHSTIELYRFPNDSRDTSGEHDYFEKDDDNYVIPRFLFEPILQK